MPLKTRCLLAFAVALLSGLICYGNLTWRNQLGADFTFTWRAGRQLLEGSDPYLEIRPAGVYPFQTYYYYPLTAALAGLPFTALPAAPAAALFFGLGSGILAGVLAGRAPHSLALFLSAPYWVALAVAQWSPLLTAAALLPGIGWLLTCKPNLGAAGFAWNPNRITLLGGLAFGLLSLAWLPTWPWDWLAVLRTLTGHPPPAAILPFGPLLLLAVLRWRDPGARSLLALSIFPQLLFFYDQLILWLIPKNFTAGVGYAAASWVGYLAWRLTGVDAQTGKILRQPDWYVLAFIYFPALALALIDRPPAWLEMRLHRGSKS